MPVATVNRAGSRQASTLWSLRCARAIDCAILPGVYLGGLIGNPASGREYRPFPVPGCPRGGLWCCDTRRGEPRVHHIYQCCYTGGCLQPGDKLRGKGFSTPTPWVATASRASRTRAIPAAFRPRPRDSRGPDHSQFQHIDPNSPQYLAALRLAKSRLGARSQSLSPPPSIQRRATMRVRWALSQRRDRMVLSIARSGSTDLPRKEA